MFRRISRSSSTSPSAPGRRTLTTTSVPSWRVAACTCPIDAAANGSGSKAAKTSVVAAPSSLLIVSSMISDATCRVVLELGQLGLKGEGEQVGACRQDLPELDE